jgi:hypothetical protein
MAMYNRNTRRVWKPGEVIQLRNLARQNTPTRVIGLKLGRTANTVRAKASEHGISLKPWNQRPHSRRR